MSDAKTNHELIQKTDLFTNLPKNELEFVISHCGHLILPKGSPLFTSGEKAKHFFILTGGAIRVFNPNEDGSEDEMAVFAAGDTIGDFDFARGAEYNACAEAAEDSELIMFPNTDFTMDSLALEEPRTICSIYLNAIIMMTGRIKSTRKLIMEDMSWVHELHRRAYEDSSTGLWKQILINDEIVGVLTEPAALIMLKPDRFKILVDSRGHSAGDEAMIKIAMILKKVVRLTGHGWALRFKSNEVGIIVNSCDEANAEKLAKILSESIATMEPVPAEGDIPEFIFSATVSWAVWPQDGADWSELFQGNYASLMDAWRTGPQGSSQGGGENIVHYRKTEE
jgi:diguanylate cyclase (GGDEF)-like protein